MASVSGKAGVKKWGYGTGMCLCGVAIPKTDNWCSDECYLPWLEEKKLAVFGRAEKTVMDTENGENGDAVEKTVIENGVFCLVCRAAIEWSGRGRRKVFCSDACRQKMRAR